MTNEDSLYEAFRNTIRDVVPLPTRYEAFRAGWLAREQQGVISRGTVEMTETYTIIVCCDNCGCKVGLVKIPKGMAVWCWCEDNPCPTCRCYALAGR